jgi:ABC-type transport system substrate-binding protein
MKQLVFSMLFSIAVFKEASAQVGTSIYDTHQYKKGIYKSFKEFRANNPSETGTLVVKDKTPAAQIYLMKAPNELFLVDSMGQEKKIKKYWGYSDGTSIYIKDNGLNKLEEIGYYCLYQIHAITSGTPNRATEGIVFNNTPPPTNNKRVLNLATGDVYDLTLFNLRKYILPQDTALLREFHQDAQNRNKLVYYIQKFNRRNTPSW